MTNNFKNKTFEKPLKITYKKDKYNKETNEVLKDDYADYAKWSAECQANGYTIKEKDNIYYCELIPEPIPPTIDEQNETIKQQRQSAYAAESDGLKNDYEEQKALLEAMTENGEPKKKIEIQQKAVSKSRAAWLAKKDEIRERFKYS